jgi:hypothetical protein
MKLPEPGNAMQQIVNAPLQEVLNKKECQKLHPYWTIVKKPDVG